MKELVDLYAKLVIGTFTFLGPSFTLFISLFYNHLVLANRRNNERIKTLAELGQNNALKKQLNKSEKDTNLLDPKRQVKRIFCSLLGSLLFIAFYYFQHTHYCSFKYEWVRITTIGLSVTFYLYCLYCLWQVFCIIIKAKSEEEEQRQTALQS